MASVGVTHPSRLGFLSHPTDLSIGASARLEMALDVFWVKHGRVP